MLLTGLVDSCMVDVNLFLQACVCQENLMSTRNHNCTKISNTVNTTDNSIACDGWSFLLAVSKHHQQQLFTTASGCFYPESSGPHPRLVFILVTTTTLLTIIASLDANFNGLQVCNTTDDFNVLLNEDCVSARGLADLVKSRPGCFNNESITSVHVTNNDNLIEYHLLDYQFQLTPGELINCSSK